MDNEECEKWAKTDMNIATCMYCITKSITQKLYYSS